MLTTDDRKACEQVAQRAVSQGIASHDRAYATCVYTTLHPERGGG